MRWKARLELGSFSGDSLGLCVAPWGDVVVVNKKALQLRERSTGELLASSPLLGLTCLDGAAEFQADGSLIVVSREGIERVRFPERTWERRVELDGASSAILRGGVALVGSGRTFRVFRLPEGEPLATLELPAEPEACDVAPDGSAVAASFSEHGLVLYPLPAGEPQTLSPAPVDHLGFGHGQLLAATKRNVLVPWSVETRQPNPLGYDSTWTSKGRIRELPDGSFLVGRWIFPARPAPAKRRWEKGTGGEELPEVRSNLSVRADGHALVGLSMFDVVYLDLGGEDPPRPFELSELGGWPPAPPGRKPLEAVSDDLRAQKRAEAREAFETAGFPERDFSAWNGSFLDPKERPESPHAYFVRLAEADVGGEWDMFGDEEVLFELKVGNARRRLHWVQLDLSGTTLSHYVAKRAGWLELPPEPRLRLQLEAYDVDVTGREHITGMVEPYALDTDALTPDVTKVEVPLTEVSETLGGGDLVLEFVRAPRRDAKDDDSKATVREALGKLPALDPIDRAAARRLATWLPSAIEDALQRAETSTHTRVRRVLPRLAALAHRVRPLAAAYGAADVAPLQAALDACNAWIAEATVLDPELKASCDALAAIQLDAPLTAARLDALTEAALRIVPDNELAPRQPLGPFHRPVDDLLEAIKAAQPGLDPEVEPTLRQAWAELVEALEAELD